MSFPRSLFKTALKAVKPNKRRPPSNHRDRGDAARDRKDWDAAANEYRQHVAKNPSEFAIWVQLGHMLKEAGKYRAASAAYLAAYRLNSADPDLLLNIGHIAKLRGLTRSSALAYRRAYEIDPSIDASRELSAFQLNSVLPLVERRFPKRHGTRSAHQLGLRRHQIGAIQHVDGWKVHGWAVDRDAPDIPAKVSFFVDGKFLSEIEVNEFRFDVDDMGYGSPIAGFTTEIPLDLSGEKPIRISARLSRTGEELDGSPFYCSAPPPIAHWLRQKPRLVGDERNMVIARLNALSDGLLSIVMPVYNTREDWLAEAIDSVITQWCDHWELICVDDCSPDPRIQAQLAAMAAKDSRIRIVTLEANHGIAAATNAGIASARGEFVAFMDHDDYLEPDAIFRILEASKSGADFIYSDEAVTSDDINVIRAVFARPAFSHDFYLSHPYFVHLNAARLSIARAIGGWDETMAISADVDFVYRMIEASKTIAHVPAVLYRWRTHRSSAGHTARDLTTPATLGAISRHLERMGAGGSVSAGYRFNTYRVSYPDDRGPTLIVIPTKNAHELVQDCLQSIWRTVRAEDDIHVAIIDHDSTDPSAIAFFKSLADDPRVSIVPYSGAFNYARMNNTAIRAMSDRFKYVLLMNNDVEAIEPGWLEHMRGLAGRAEVGMVGASLIYGNRTYQHAGVVMGLGDLVDHAHKYVPMMTAGRRNDGYNCSLVSVRDYLAVTGACMMTRRDLFLSVGGFDEALAIGFNDTDLCLRIGSLGYKVLNDAFAVLYHHESITRQKVGSMDHPDDYRRFKARWGHILVSGDPFYNHMLLPNCTQDHRIGEITGARVAARIRETQPVLQDTAEGTPEAVDDRQARNAMTARS